MKIDLFGVTLKGVYSFCTTYLLVGQKVNMEIILFSFRCFRRDNLWSKGIEGGKGFGRIPYLLKHVEERGLEGMVEEGAFPDGCLLNMWQKYNIWMRW